MQCAILSTSIGSQCKLRAKASAPSGRSKVTTVSLPYPPTRPSTRCCAACHVKPVDEEVEIVCCSESNTRALIVGCVGCVTAAATNWAGTGHGNARTRRFRMITMSDHSGALGKQLLLAVALPPRQLTRKCRPPLAAPYSISVGDQGRTSWPCRVITAGHAGQL